MVVLETRERVGRLAGRGGVDEVIDRAAACELLDTALAPLRHGLRRVLVLPPDFTRYHSGAGELSVIVDELLGGAAQVDFMPALGTHSPMTRTQLEQMFPGIAVDRFLVHDWRTGLVPLGAVPGSFVAEVSDGLVDFDVDIAIDQAAARGEYDLILSIGQVVPHEVVGMANHNKNIFVGIGGRDIINKSHFLGAVYGMERIMGRADTPVRRVFNEAEKLIAHLPIVYVLMVRQRDETGAMVTRGLYVGDDPGTFMEAAQLAQQCNLDRLEAPLSKVVVYLDPDEFKSTWLGNKAIYRTRMALADGGELLVLAPGLREFGEDPEIDRLIRRYGYRGTPATLAAVRSEPELADNLSAAAHLIHGSSEGRFSITYAPGHLSREEIEGVGFGYQDLAQALRRYDPARLVDGFNLVDGEEVFYISNPALGLWALRDAFDL